MACIRSQWISRLLAIYIGLTFCPAYPGECNTTKAVRQGSLVTYELDRVWSGARTAVASAISPKGQVLVAYYDADRFVSVASLSPHDGRVCRKRLPSRFAGWDSHHDLKLAVSADGILHLAGNAHVDPLFYARGNADDVATVLPTTMIGADESRATYPRFMQGPGKDLLFLYRNGSSGSGEWLINRWNGASWSRLGTLFASRDAQGPVSAYPSSIERDRSGFYHVAVVWRRNPDVASNFAVGYASTRDFRRWRRADGEQWEGPISPDNNDVVEATGEGAGLVNGAQLVLTPDGNPVIAYNRYGAEGTDAAVLATPMEGKWKIVEAARSSTRSNVRGGGSLPNLPRVSLKASGDFGQILALFPPKARQRLTIDLQTLSPVTDIRGRAPLANADPQEASLPIQISIPDGLPDAAILTSGVHKSGFDGPHYGRIAWYAQPSLGDAPRACTNTAPLACRPPASPLVWAIAAEALSPTP